MKIDFDNAIKREYKKGDVVLIQYKDRTDMGYYQIIYCPASNRYGVLRLKALHFLDFEADTPEQAINKLMDDFGDSYRIVKVIDSDNIVMKTLE